MSSALCRKRGGISPQSIPSTAPSNVSKAIAAAAPLGSRFSSTLHSGRDSSVKTPATASSDSIDMISDQNVITSAAAPAMISPAVHLRRVTAFSMRFSSFRSGWENGQDA